jgi:sulfite exporter TauE/SafE
MATLGAVFVVSLLGSLHCVGMCGPLVAVAMGDSQVRSHATRAALHFGYHGGRFVMYTAIGMLCGLLGAGLDWGGSLVGLQRAAALLVGGTMVLIGTIGVLRYSGVRFPKSRSAGLVQRWVVRGQRTAMHMKPLPRATVIGLLTAFLPCGWLYLFAVVATSTSSVFMGGAVMAAFWLGSVPLLSVVGISVQTLAGTVGRRVPLLTSLIVVLLGVFTIGGRLTIPATAFEPTLQHEAGSDTLLQVEAAGQTTPPCCKNHGD